MGRRRKGQRRATILKTWIARCRIGVQLKANQIEVTNLRREIALLKAKISDYDSRLNEQPALDQQLAELVRG